ncbi:MAG: hypothetical protein AMXMBFR76_11630 [Pseudomonadota bacterium]
MNIAFVSIGDPADPHYHSGRHHNIMRNLERAGFRVTVIGPLDRSLRWLYSPQKLFYKALSYEMQVDRHVLMRKWYALQISRRITGEDVDIILSPSTIPVSELQCKQPIITWTDASFALLDGYYGGAFSRPAPLTRKAAYIQERASLRRAAAAIYSSDWAADGTAEAYGVPRGKIAVIPSGPYLEIAHTSEDIQVWIERRLTSSRLRLLFVGQDWGRKGGPIALETTRLLNEYGIPAELVIVGCDPGEARASPYVDIKGFIKKTERTGLRMIQELFASCHMLILPTLADASPNVIAEAAAFGLPVIARDTGGVSTYLRDGVNGILMGQSASPHDYAERIRELWADLRRYSDMARGSYKHYEKELSWRAAIGKFGVLAEQVMREKELSDLRGSSQW